MKAAISLRDQLFEEAEETAKYLGLPRSRLVAKALEEFIQNHNRDRITAQLNKVYGEENPNIDDQIGNIGVSAIREFTKNDTW